MHNGFQGEWPFPQFGDGVVVRFKSSDMARLRGRYGSPPGTPPRYDEKGNRVDHFWQILFTGINDIDPLIITDLLRAGLKKPGGKDPVEGIDFDDLPIPFIECCQPLLEGIMLARWGKTTAEYAREEAAAEAEENPQTGPETVSTSSTGSSGPDGAPA
ncbi:hypothetical protein [uncultured Alsobacter sp.]|uniref:hypothetical protein n=1 Tax=uncultured Alsobacter sp. TaxID=1748258 RepID=UPI0025F98059|nr:hypothetical protein [uncultured Alsobacter sp.]